MGKIDRKIIKKKKVFSYAHFGIKQRSEKGTPRDSGGRAESQYAFPAPVKQPREVEKETPNRVARATASAVAVSLMPS